MGSPLEKKEVLAKIENGEVKVQGEKKRTVKAKLLPEGRQLTKKERIKLLPALVKGEGQKKAKAIVKAKVPKAIEPSQLDQPDKTFTCPKCKEAKPLTREYFHLRVNKDGSLPTKPYDRYCKPCYKAYWKSLPSHQKKKVS